MKMKLVKNNDNGYKSPGTLLVGQFRPEMIPPIMLPVDLTLEFSCVVIWKLIGTFVGIMFT